MPFARLDFLSFTTELPERLDRMGVAVAEVLVASSRAYSGAASRRDDTVGMFCASLHQR